MAKNRIKGGRIVVVCPHNELNAFFNRAIPLAFGDPTVDIISNLESMTPAGLPTRESGKPHPTAVFDFGVIADKYIASPGASSAYDVANKRRALIREAVESYASKSDLSFPGISLEDDLVDPVERTPFITPVVLSLAQGLEAHLRAELAQTLPQAGSITVPPTSGISLVPTTAYRDWAWNASVPYFAPSPSFKVNLTPYQVEGKSFDPDSMRIAAYKKGLESDLLRISSGSKNPLYFFSRIHSPSASST